MNNFLPTERKVFTEKYWTAFFCTDGPRRVSFVEKNRGPIFLGKDRASEANENLIIWHEACICF